MEYKRSSSELGWLEEGFWECKFSKGIRSPASLKKLGKKEQTRMEFLTGVVEGENYKVSRRS